MPDLYHSSLVVVPFTIAAVALLWALAAIILGAREERQMRAGLKRMKEREAAELAARAAQLRTRALPRGQLRIVPVQQRGELSRRPIIVREWR